MSMHSVEASQAARSFLTKRGFPVPRSRAAAVKLAHAWAASDRMPPRWDVNDTPAEIESYALCDKLCREVAQSVRPVLVRANRAGYGVQDLWLRARDIVLGATIADTVVADTADLVLEVEAIWADYSRTADMWA